MMPAGHDTALRESRPTGSPRMFSAGISGNNLATVSAYEAPVHTTMLVSGTRPATLSYAIRSRLIPLMSSNSCLGSP